MDRSRWTVLCLALLLAGLIAVGSPRTATAALDGAYLYGLQEDSGTAVPPNQPLVSVPGVFSLLLGEGVSMTDDGLRVEMAQVDLPAINATATVNGLSFNLRDQNYGWESITLNQIEPMGGQAITVSDLQANVQGKATNYTTDVSTRIDVHPNDNVQAGATLAMSYDGLAGQASLSIADGAAQVAVGPATIAVKGVSVQDGALAVDAAQILVPEAGVGVRIDGYTRANGQSDWTALTWYGQEFKLGDVATFSDTLVVAPGPSAATQAPVGATTHFEIKAGDVAQVEGQLVFTYDSASGEPSLGLLDADAQFGVPAWNLAVSGVNAGKKGTTVDTVLFTAAPLGVQAQVTGIAVDSTNAVTFDQARLLYVPAQPSSGQAVGGFEMVVDSTDAGYVVSTTTFLPTAKVE